MTDALDKIGLKYGTDKASVHHNYLSRYEVFLAGQPHPMRLLEIGVHEGASIRMWLEFLPDSHIEGIDIENRNCAKVDDPRYTFHHGNATNKDLWDRLGMFDVIIDDGSHLAHEVKATFDLGFSHVNSGGLWVIEDTDVAYEPMWGAPGKTVFDLFRIVLDELNDYGRGLCGDPCRDKSRVGFMHFSKSMLFIGKR